MATKLQQRLRRSRRTRAKIKELRQYRLSVHKSNSNIYAQLLEPNGSKVLVSASTLEKDLRSKIKNGGGIAAAKLIGEAVAKKAKKAGISKVAFDRSGYKFHGRVKALADAARESGLEF